MSNTLASPLVIGSPVFSGEDLAVLPGPAEFVPAPTLTPESAAFATATHNTLVTAQFSDGANRNTWVYLAGIGWRELSRKSDGGAQALTMLCGLARSLGCAPTLIDDADGVIQSVYVF